MSAKETSLRVRCWRRISHQNLKTSPSQFGDRTFVPNWPKDASICQSCNQKWCSMIQRIAMNCNGFAYRSDMKWLSLYFLRRIRNATGKETCNLRSFTDELRFSQLMRSDIFLKYIDIAWHCMLATPISGNPTCCRVKAQKATVVLSLGHGTSGDGASVWPCGGAFA